MSCRQDQIIFESEILSHLTKENPFISKTSLKWKLYNYLKDNSMIRVGEKKYICKARVYSYEFYSQLSKDIDELCCSSFPNIKVVIWESRQLNEWLNFLLATNIIYVEVEKEYVDYIFSFLNDRLGEEKLVLSNPNEDMIAKYLRNDLVVVKPLYSKSPISHKDRKIKLEKLAVDIFCGEMSLDTRGKEDVIVGIKNNYDIDKDKMMAYAARRRVKNAFMSFWENDYDRFNDFW